MFYGKPSLYCGLSPYCGLKFVGAVMLGRDRNVKEDGRKRLKPGTSSEYISKTQWVQWQFDEASKR